MGTGDESGVMIVNQESRKGVEKDEEGDRAGTVGLGNNSKMTSSWLQCYS